MRMSTRIFQPVLLTKEDFYWVLENLKGSGGGGGKVRPARMADKLTAICEPIV
jgi:hypothetical protein